MRPRWAGKCFQSLIKHRSNAVAFSDNWEATVLLGIVANFENKIWNMNANTLLEEPIGSQGESLLDFKIQHVSSIVLELSRKQTQMWQSLAQWSMCLIE